ncbi:MAG TPA: ABC transporter substrate-binding protein [Candidatus Cybelea sp.]|nr:ABC transporter substrate-binding protein [Candidatus Cybelea sp.]
MKPFFGVVSALALSLGAFTANAQISDNVIRIGVLNDQSGPYADITGHGSYIAAQMAAEDIGGSVLGKPIEFLEADTQNKPDVASSIAREWIDAKQVDVIADGAASSTALAIQEVVREKKRIFLASGPASSDFTGKACSPYGFQWTYDTYALAKGTGGAMVKQGGDSWFFITADYAFGYALETDTGNFVKNAGGKVLGSVRAPLNTQDFSSFLLQAQASKAKVIGLANAGTDFSNSLKQSAEFGIVAGGQKLAALLVQITDINALGLKVAQGVVFTDPFYWDRDDKSRAFGKRFMAKHDGKAPSAVQAGTYSSVLSYLRAVKAAGTDNADKVRAELLKAKLDTPMDRDGWVREDGRVMHEMLLVQVKKPEESKYPWDYEKILAVIPADQAWRPLNEGNCPYVKKS